MTQANEIPRAISTNPDDPRYQPDYGGVGIWLDVFLDGVRQRDVCTYDMDEGFVVAADRDAAGKLLLNEAKDEVLLTRYNGVVTVERHRGPRG